MVIWQLLSVRDLPRNPTLKIPPPSAHTRTRTHAHTHTHTHTHTRTQTDTNFPNVFRKLDSSNVSWPISLWDLDESLWVFAWSHSGIRNSQGHKDSPGSLNSTVTPRTSKPTRDQWKCATEPTFVIPFKLKMLIQSVDSVSYSTKTLLLQIT